MAAMESSLRAPIGQTHNTDLIRLSAAALDALNTDDPSEQTLLNLHAIFGSTLQAAMELVDRGEVVQIKLPTGRFLHQVASSNGRPYTLYMPYVLTPSSLPYCPCTAFAFSAILGGKTVVCKHLLALGIAERTGRIVQTEVGQEAMLGLLGITT